MKKKDKILEWLRGRRDYSEGVALYQQFGLNIRLKREFGFGESSALKEILVASLMDIAGVDEARLRLLSLPGKPSHSSRYPLANGEEKKMLRFRDRFPFLRDADCPDVLKIAVADLLTSFDNCRKAHRELTSASDEDMKYSECKEAVENFLTNRQCWELLEYYKEHHSLPPGNEEEKEGDGDELSSLSDLDLASKYKSAVANESKQRKKLSIAREKGESEERAEEMVRYWSMRKEALKEEIEKRKKK